MPLYSLLINLPRVKTVNRVDLHSSSTDQPLAAHISPPISLITRLMGALLPF